MSMLRDASKRIGSLRRWIEQERNVGIKGMLETPHKIENKTKLKLLLNSTTAHALLFITTTFSFFPLLLHYRKLLKTTARYWYRNWKRLRPWSEWFSSSGVSELSTRKRKSNSVRNRAQRHPRSPRCNVTNYCEFQKFTATTNEIESNESNHAL